MNEALKHAVKQHINGLYKRIGEDKVIDLDAVAQCSALSVMQDRNLLVLLKEVVKDVVREETQDYSITAGQGGGVRKLK